MSGCCSISIRGGDHIITILLILTGLICHVIIYYTYRGQANYREGMLFAILLPEGASSDPEIQQIQKNYNKRMKLYNRWLIASYIPILALYPWISFQIIYFLSWLVIIIFLITQPFRQAFQATIALKREHEWYVKSKQEIDGEMVNDDGDEYWSNGFTYHNANDPRVLIPKRIGIGETINTATLTGKLVIGGTIGITAILFVFISFIIIRSEFTSPAINFSEPAVISIEYPMYSYNFSVEDVIDVTLVDEYPKATKINGEATSDYLRGQFRMKELGKTRMYVFKHNPPYICIQLENGYIFYNDQNPDTTIRVYETIEMLQQAQSKPLR